MSEYLKLAEKIGEDINIRWFCCVELSKKKSEEFERWFEPTREECYRYNHSDVFWMTECGLSREQNNNFRILALCLMHEISLTEGGNP